MLLPEEPVGKFLEPRKLEGRSSWPRKLEGRSSFTVPRGCGGDPSTLVVLCGPAMGTVIMRSAKKSPTIPGAGPPLVGSSSQKKRVSVVAADR